MDFEIRDHSDIEGRDFLLMDIRTNENLFFIIKNKIQTINENWKWIKWVDEEKTLKKKKL